MHAFPHAAVFISSAANWLNVRWCGVWFSFVDDVHGMVLRLLLLLLGSLLKTGCGFRLCSRFHGGQISLCTVFYRTRVWGVRLILGASSPHTALGTAPTVGAKHSFSSRCAPGCMSNSFASVIRKRCILGVAHIVTAWPAVASLSVWPFMICS